MATDLERLTVLIEANTKSYERSMLRMQQQTDRAIRGASKSIGGLNAALNGATRTALGFIGVWSVSRVATEIRGIVKELADLKDAADLIGISTDRLQELQYQAEQTGVDVDAMAEALKTFAKRLSEAQRGKGELADLFGANFIDARQFKTTEEALEAIVELIGKARDEAAAIDIGAMAAGRGGASVFAQMFAGGPEAAKAFNDEMARTNDMFTEEQIAKAAQYDDELEKLIRHLKVNIKGGIVDYLSQLRKEINFVKTFGFTRLMNVSLGQGKLDPDRVKDDAIEAGERVGEAFSEGFSNTGFEDLETALQKKASIAPGADYTILPPDPEKIQEAKGQLRELLETRYEHIELITDEQKAITDLIAEMERERSLIGATDEEIAKSNALREAGIYATGEQREQIAGLAVAMVQEQKALDDLIESMDTLRDAGASAMDSFVQSLADAKTPMEALKAGFVDILQSIIRIAEQAAITNLFGAAGKPGGGLLGGIVGGVLGAAPGIGSVAPAKAAASQAMAVHITAEPSPLLNLTITKSSQAAEERAIARGPVVARNNQMRYGIA